MNHQNRARRGSWNSRGGYTRRTTPSSAAHDLPPDRNLLEGLGGKPIEVISIPSASTRAAAFSGTLIENVEYVGSYNWTESRDPTIIVPGSPPIWNARRVPFTLSPDARVALVDQNSYRMQGSSSFLPLFAAVDASGTIVDWPSIDIITDRNALRKLIRWIGGNASKEFRIDLELLGDNTVVLNRWEKRYREVPKYETYGFSFEEETTNVAPGCASSTGHHRIVKYDYFGLKMVVRFEVDACLPTTTTSSPRSSSSGHDLDDLSAVLNQLGVDASPTSASSNSSNYFGVAVVKGGSVVPQSAIVELTTRNSNYIDEFDWAEALPQLYLSSTPQLYIGLHRRGTFSEIRKHDLNGNALVQKRREAAESYEKLGRALEAIQGLVVEHGVDGGLSLVFTGGVLRVYKRSDSSLLIPNIIRSRFDGA